MKYFFNRINVFSKSPLSIQNYSRAGLHAEKREKFPFNFGTFVHVAKAISRHGKTHMACIFCDKPCVFRTVVKRCSNNPQITLILPCRFAHFPNRLHIHRTGYSKHQNSIAPCIAYSMQASIMSPCERIHAQ